MITTSNARGALGLAACAAFAALATPVADACTRAVYFGKEGQTITCRSMDWSVDMQSELWIFPRGMARDGAVGDKSLRWTSKHGSVITSIYDGGTADGMNEKGLVANLLYLAESEYAAADDMRPGITITAWAQYVLDSFATVEECVTEMRKEAFRVVAVESLEGQAGSVHLAISDRSGDSAIFEYVKGRLVIHHGRQYQVMTNSPTFEKQLALAEYWKQIGGTVMLPGTNRAADRFARASFYIGACEQTANPRMAVAAAFSVIRNCSVPRGIARADQPNLSSTIWRTVSDQKNGVYYFENTASPSLVWVTLARIDFAEQSGVRKLPMVGKLDFGGDQTATRRLTS